jgi:hypothetical protein
MICIFSVSTPLPRTRGAKAWATRPRLKTNCPALEDLILILPACNALNTYLSTGEKQKLAVQNVHKLFCLGNTSTCRKINTQAMQATNRYARIYCNVLYAVVHT